MRRESPEATRGLLATLTPLAIWAAAACGGGPEAAREADRPPAAMPAAVPESSPDERLAKAVQQAFLQAPALAGQDIRIAASRGHVLLMGRVSAPHLRDEAVAVAGSVPGVRGVDSRLEVGR